MTAIIIAAHNEASVIGRCLDALKQEGPGDEFEVIVVANGCSDDTAAQAESHNVRVIELRNPGKARALNAGDAVVTSFPRLYLDADMALSANDIRTLSETLQTNMNFLACAPKRAIEFTNRPLAVRAYFAVQQRLPVYDDALVGRGAIMLSEAGRARFTQFPDETADDLFLDALFAPAERTIVDSVTCVIEVPYTTRDLLRRLVRVRRGNIQLRRAHQAASYPDNPPVRLRRSDRLSWLRDVVLPHPKLAPAGIVYATLTLLAEWQASRSTSHQTWGRDESTRRLASG